MVERELQTIYSVDVHSKYTVRVPGPELADFFAM